MRDPMGLLLMAGRVDPVLREATHAVEAELTDLRALRDAIPGDDKRLVAEWAVKIAAEECDRWRRAGDPSYPDPNSLNLTDAIMGCPPSVRAALRSNEVQP